MKKALLTAVAISLTGVAGSAIAADLPLSAPWTAPFSWTSCYFGAHLGGGWARKDITDPVQLAQDTVNIALGGGPITTGVTTVSVGPTGILVGGQLGCDYQFAPHWVVGIEGSASGSTMRGDTIVGLPLGFTGEQALVHAGTDMIPSITARFGYAFDRVLLYAKGGVAWAGDRYSVTGTFTGTPFDFEGLDLRPGWTVGGGVDWAFAGHWSANLEYDYYSFGQGSVLMIDVVNGNGPVNVRQSVQVIKAGLNFHMWSR
jgi:opacity protein-like surface antigen